MTSDRQERIREHIKILKAIEESLREMRTEDVDEIKEWRDESMLTMVSTWHVNQLDSVMSLSNAICHIETCVWSLEHL